MKINRFQKTLLFLLVIPALNSCEEFLEIEVPDHKMISEVVFDTDETALSALKGLHNQLYNAQFSNGFDGVTVLAGLSSDNLSPIRTTSSTYLDFEEHEILLDNSRNFNLWKSAYNVIYLSNSLLEGIENSDNLSTEVYDQIKGEASFVRGFTHFYLVNLYGEVPLVLSTNYKDNSLIRRNSTDEIYQQILNDLETAENLLGVEYKDQERTQVVRYASQAMLARVHLYLKNWSEAERLSGEVIAQTGTYELLADLNQVFLANSKEAIWQITPEAQGYNLTHTGDGSVLIINPARPNAANIKLEPSFVATLKNHDERLHKWIGFDESLGVYFAYKYKIRNSYSFPIEEYTMALRLAEQHLIRAEARAMLGDRDGAINDLDVIRARAGLDPLSDFVPLPEGEQLVELIMDERQRELFAEWGHRWLDIKRTGKSSEIFYLSNPQWEETDELYPIPEAELMKNPNLHQNPGY